MSNENSGPLSITLPTSTTKSAMPQIASNTWAKFKYAAPVKQRTIAGEGKGDVLDFEFHLAEPASDTEGKTINPGGVGSKQFHTVFMYGKDGKEAALDRATKEVNKILDAMLGTGDPGNAKGKPARPDFNNELQPSLIGLTFWGKVRARQNDPSRNDIVEFRHESEMQTAGA